LTRSRAFFCAFLLAALYGFSSTLGKAPVPASPAREKTFDLELIAGFLEPGWQKSTERRGDEIRFGPVSWVSPTTGLVRAEMWDVFADVTFETDGSRKKTNAIRIDPVTRNKDESPWNLWRHRHGYQFFYGKGYFFNSLADVRPSMDPAGGAFYDHVLRNVWGYWVRKRLNDYLATGNTGKGADWSSVAPSSTAPSIMEKPIRLKYSARGLERAAPVLFQINLWHVPVKIDFEIVRSTEPRSSGNFISLSHGYRWKYNMAEWRRRHGYQKTFLGNYEWENGFPDEKKITEKEGKLLDGLMDRSVESWVEAAMAQVLFDLNRKLSGAMAELGPTTKNQSDAAPNQPATQ